MKTITEKILIIEEIARQTHILSLNATIEACKAQEAGKGFGVVSREVRELAERSRAAAAEINYLAGSGMEIAEKTRKMLRKLVPNIQKTAELVQEISAASNEQDKGTEQINTAVQQLDQVIQQNVATSEEMSSTAEELANQAEHLQKVIEFFKTEETVQKETVQKETVKERFGNEHMHTQHLTGVSTATAETNGHEKENVKPLGIEPRPAGYAISMSPTGNNGDERDAEFERF
jgi:methyl-accepting chemotaxis protein